MDQVRHKAFGHVGVYKGNGKIVSFFSGSVREGDILGLFEGYGGNSKDLLYGFLPSRDAQDLLVEANLRKWREAGMNDVYSSRYDEALKNTPATSVLDGRPEAAELRIAELKAGFQPFALSGYSKIYTTAYNIAKDEGIDWTLEGLVAEVSIRAGVIELASLSEDPEKNVIGITGAAAQALAFLHLVEEGWQLSDESRLTAFGPGLRARNQLSSNQLFRDDVALQMLLTVGIEDIASLERLNEFNSIDPALLHWIEYEEIDLEMLRVLSLEGFSSQQTERILEEYSWQVEVGEGSWLSPAYPELYVIPAFRGGKVATSTAIGIGRKLFPKTGRLAIPKNWVKSPTQTPGGIQYSDPKNSHNWIRRMPGNKNSPFPNSKNEYVRWQKDGKALDRFGKKLPSEYLPDAHIPVDSFRFLPNLFK